MPARRGKSQKASAIIANAIAGNSGTAQHDTHQRIARRAYELYVQRGRQDGNDLADWFQAEAEIVTGDMAPEP